MRAHLLLSVLVIGTLATPLGCTREQCVNDTFGIDDCAVNNVWIHSCWPWIMAAPKVHLVFWGSWWTLSGSSQMDSMVLAWNVLANDPRFYAPLAQYGVGPGSLVGVSITAWDLPVGQISDAAIQQELVTEINGQELGNDSIYVVMLPETTLSGTDVTHEFIGYHAVVGGTSVAYAVVDFSDQDTMDVTASHEIYESATDSDGRGYRGPGDGESELADYCDGIRYTLDGYAVQQVWSQSTCACNP